MAYELVIAIHPHMPFFFITEIVGFQEIVSTMNLIFLLNF